MSISLYFLLFFVVSVSAHNRCPEGWKRLPYTKRCFKVFNVEKGVTADEAKDACQKTHADLASVHSAKDLEFLTKLSTTGETKKSHFNLPWIGITRTGDQQWVNVDGSAAEGIEWGESEPHSGPIDDCVQLVSDMVESSKDSKPIYSKIGVLVNNICRYRSDSYICERTVS